MGSARLPQRSALHKRALDKIHAPQGRHQTSHTHLGFNTALAAKVIASYSEDFFSRKLLPTRLQPWKLILKTRSTVHFRGSLVVFLRRGHNHASRAVQQPLQINSQVAAIFFIQLVKFEWLKITLSSPHRK